MANECKHAYSDRQHVWNSNGGYMVENITATVEGRYLHVHIGGDDYYADEDRVPIKFCPFCGEKVEDTDVQKEN